MPYAGGRLTHIVCAGVLLCMLGLPVASLCRTNADHPASGPIGPMKVAITVDDIPENGPPTPGFSRTAIAHRIIEVLKDYHINHVYGFANGNFLREHPDELGILKEWLAAGNALGNHTFSHLDLNRADFHTYVANVAAEESLLSRLVGPSSGKRHSLFFRYPYLDEGDDLAKRDSVRAYLAERGYRIAEVTTDYNDWAWNCAYARGLSQRNNEEMERLKDQVAESADRHLRSSSATAKLMFGRDIPHIMLIHMCYFTAVTLDMLLTRWHAQGVEFVSLEEALADPVYSINPNLAYKNGLHFLDQIAKARHLDVQQIEDTPDSLDGLRQVCRNLPRK